MSVFGTYLGLGFDHIVTIEAFDHIVFVLALCAIYKPEQWKQILVLVTAFTIGHSITLILCSLDIFAVRSDIVEFFIPVTILLTAIFNVASKDRGLSTRKIRLNYGLALIFGLIHGMAFSTIIGSAGVTPLLAFNIGIELGQLLVVAAIFLVFIIVLNVFRIQQKDWKVFLSGAAAGIAVLLMIENKFW